MNIHTTAEDNQRLYGQGPSITAEDRIKALKQSSIRRNRKLDPSEYADYRAALKQYIDGRMSHDQSQEALKRFGKTPECFDKDSRNYARFLSLSDKPAPQPKNVMAEVSTLRAEKRVLTKKLNELRAKHKLPGLVKIRKQLANDITSLVNQCKSINAKIWKLVNQETPEQERDAMVYIWPWMQSPVSSSSSLWKELERKDNNL